MAAVTADIFREFDAVLDSIGLLLEVNEEQGYEFDGEDLIVERNDTDQELDQNRLDTLFHGGNRAWHEGYNQRRLSMPGSSSPYRFLSSKGIDISEPGEIQLLPETSKVLSLSNSAPNAPQKMVATDLYIFVAAGAPNVKRFSSLDASDVVIQDHQGSTSEVLDMTTDGTVVYVALSTHGIHRSVEPGTTQQEAFDSGSWTNSTAGITNSYDTSDKKEGTGALKILVADTTGGNVEKTFGATKDLSAVDTFKIWIKVNRATSSGEVKVRLIDSTGNYFERSVPALAANTWYEDASARTTDWAIVGAPSWASIDKMAIVVPAISSPAFRAVTTVDGLVNNAVDGFGIITKPTGTTEGDLLLFTWAESTEGTDEITVSLGGFTTIQDTPIAAAGARLFSAYKIATASEPASYTFDMEGQLGGSTWVWAATLSAYSGVDTASPINTSSENQDSATPDTSIVASSITPTVGGCRLVAVYAWCQDSPSLPDPATTPPGGSTLRAEEIKGSGIESVGIAVADEAQGVAAVTGTRTATTSENTDRDFAHLIALKPAASPVEVRADDLRSVIASAFAHWSDFDARVLGWAKDRVYAAGVKTGTTWRFFQADSLATSTEIFVLPEGWEVSDIVEQQGFVYFTAYRKSLGVVYVYDGTNAPFIAYRLPPGILPLSLIPFAGAGLLIGCRRVSSGSGGLGLLLRGFLTASGALSVEPITEIGAEDGTDYGIRCGMEIFDQVYFGWPYADALSSGLGVYFPDVEHKGAVARHIHGSTAAGVIDCVWFKGRRVFTLDGQGVYMEQTSRVTSGQVISSLIDANVAADKLWILQQSDFSLVTGSLVQHEYSTDDGVTWSGLTEASSGSVLRSIIGVKSPRIQYRLTMTRGTTTSQSPKVFYAGIGGWPASKPGGVHGLLIRAYNEMETRSGRKIVDPDGGYTLFNQLETRRRNHDLLDYQPPWWPKSNTVLKVRVARVRMVGPWGTLGDAQGGLIHVVLKEAPTI